MITAVLLAGAIALTPGAAHPADMQAAHDMRSSARGAYQFLDSQWRVSLTHMLMPEHKDRKKEVKALRKKPIHEWNRYWQDAAFYVAWRNGKGAKHWYYPGSNCIG